MTWVACVLGHGLTAARLGGGVGRRAGRLGGLGSGGPGLVGGRGASACQASQQAAHTRRRGARSRVRPGTSSIRVAVRGHARINPRRQRYGALSALAGRRRRATPRRRARPSGRPRTAPPRACPSTRGSAASSTGRRARPPGVAVPRRAVARPRSPPSATGWIPTGVPNAGTPHASASITDEPEALAPGRHEHRVRGVDPVAAPRPGRDAAHRQQRRVARRLARAVEALQRPRGIVRGTAGSGRRGRARAARAPRARGIGRKRSRSIADRAARRRGASSPAPGTSPLNSRETAAGERRERQDRRASAGPSADGTRSLPCSVTTTGPSRAASAGHAVRPKCACTTSKRSPAVAPPQLARGARVAAQAGRRTRTARPRRPRAAAAPRPGRARSEPSAGRSGVGYMFVTTSARIEGAEPTYAVSPTCRRRV